MQDLSDAANGADFVRAMNAIIQHITDEIDTNNALADIISDEATGFYEAEYTERMEFIDEEIKDATIRQRAMQQGSEEEEKLAAEIKSNGDLYAQLYAEQQSDLVQKSANGVNVCRFTILADFKIYVESVGLRNFSACVDDSNLVAAVGDIMQYIDTELPGYTLPDNTQAIKAAVAACVKFCGDVKTAYDDPDYARSIDSAANGAKLQAMSEKWEKAWEWMGRTVYSDVLGRLNGTLRTLMNDHRHDVDNKLEEVKKRLVWDEKTTMVEVHRVATRKVAEIETKWAEIMSNSYDKELRRTIESGDDGRIYSYAPVRAAIALVQHTSRIANAPQAADWRGAEARFELSLTTYLAQPPWDFKTWTIEKTETKELKRVANALRVFWEDAFFVVPGVGGINKLVPLDDVGVLLDNPVMSGEELVRVVRVIYWFIWVVSMTWPSP